jgi:hypothetical protein
MLTAFAITLAIGTLLMLAVNPVIGIVLLFISKPIIDATWDVPLFLGMPLTQIISGLVPIFVVGRMVIAKNDESFRLMPLKWIWLVYVCYAAIFSAFILYNQDPQSAANIFFRYGNGFAGFYMLQAFFHQDHRQKLLFLAMMIGGLFPIGVGLYQLATGTTWQVQDIEGISRNIGMYHDAITIRHYAMQTILAIFLFGSVSTHQHILQLAGRWLYLSLAIAVMAKAYSKAGFLTLGLWVVCWNGLQKRFLAVSFLALFGFLGGSYYATQHIDQIVQIYHKEISFIQGQGEAERTFNGRWYLWQQMYGEWGQLDWPAKTFGSGKVALGSHNDYFQMLFHGGIFGLLIYLVLLGTIGFRILTNLRRKADPMTIAGLMALTSWLVDTIGLVPSSYSGYQWFIWGIIGLSVRQRNVEEATVLPAYEITVDCDPLVAQDSTEADLRGNLPMRKFPLLSDSTSK